MKAKKMTLLWGIMLVLTLSVMPAAAAGLLVDVDWLKKHGSDPNVRIVDVQNKADAYGKGHIPGAVMVDRHADLADPTRYTPNKYPQLEQFLALVNRLGIDNDTTVVAYDDHHGIFASRLLFIMELYGHDTGKLKILDGGTVQWKAAGNALVTEETRVPAASYASKGANKALLVEWSDVLRDVVKARNAGVMLLDVRPAAEYNAEKIRAIRGGRIPGAVNITGQDAANHKDEHTYKSADRIREAFAAAGLTQDRTVYAYCHSSDRSAHAYMVLTHILGHRNVKIYDGAWSEWAALSGLPVEEERWLMMVEKVQ